MNSSVSKARPVSEVLEQEVLRELRQRGIVFWLDRAAHFSDFVDGLVERSTRGDFPHPVVPFRGSFLETMLAVEDLQGGLDQTPLLIHLPGFTEELVRGTPLLELYKAGFRYRRALDTLVRDAATGRVPLEEIEAFLARTDLSLSGADAWLGSLIGEGQQGLAGLLERTSFEVVLRELLVKDTFLKEQLDRSPELALDALRDFLKRKVGMSDSWVEFIGEDQPEGRRFSVLKDALESWVLCVEYVDDLLREPHLAELKPLGELPKSIVTLCRDQARALREQHPDVYESIAERVEGHLVLELPEIEPEDLGCIDTFRTEEARILGAAIDALRPGLWAKAREWAETHHKEGCFWLRRDQRRRMTWNIVAHAARLGCLLEERTRPLGGVTSFEDAVERYTGDAFEVDRAHRRFEQRCLSLLSGQQVDHYAKLKNVQTQLRRLYSEWADLLARDFSELCRTRGMLPDASLQQRTFYEQVVHPLTQGRERTAVFLVDALRYEMAVELVEELGGPGTKVDLAARLAELPTITSVGMNAVAPVAQEGRLHLAGTKGFGGFRAGAGEFVVKDPESRARAMGQRSTGARALRLSLSQVCELPAKTLKKKVAQKQLIVVNNRDLDKAGEAGMGLATFEQTLGEIKAAWHHLKSAGVKQAVITSDHGFLLLLQHVETLAGARSWGKKTDPDRRYVLDQEGRNEDGLLVASFAELGYQGREGFLHFCEDTRVFDTGDKRQSFVHGGNSPQERIVPVITVTSKHAPNVDLTAYRALAEPEADAVGCHRMRVRLAIDKEQTATLGFLKETPVSMSLQVRDRTRIRVSVKDVTGKGSVKGGRLLVPPGDEWSEVFFTLEGPKDERVRLELYHPDGVEQVVPCEVDAWFQVEGKGGAEAVEPPQTEGWEDDLPDDGTRQIFVHLAQHGSITEVEATKMLGSPRKFRRFSRRFETFRAKTPLRVRIESAAEGKRYVREGTADGT